MLVVPLFCGLASARGGEAIRDDQLWFWAYLVNIGMSFPAAGMTITLDTVHLWSLSFEEQFYLVWPVIVLLLPRKGLIATCVVLVIATLPLRYVMGIEPLSDHLSDGAPRFLVPAHADTLAMGALVAMALRDEGGRALLSRLTVPACIVGGGLVVALFLWRDGLQPTDPWVYTFG